MVSFHCPWLQIAGFFLIYAIRDLHNSYGMKYRQKFRIYNRFLLCLALLFIFLEENDKDIYARLLQVLQSKNILLAAFVTSLCLVCRETRYSQNNRLQQKIILQLCKVAFKDISPFFAWCARRV